MDLSRRLSSLQDFLPAARELLTWESLPCEEADRHSRKVCHSSGNGSVISWKFLETDGTLLALTSDRRIDRGKTGNPDVQRDAISQHRTSV